MKGKYLQMIQYFWCFWFYK